MLDIYCLLYYDYYLSACRRDCVTLGKQVRIFAPSVPDASESNANQPDNINNNINPEIVTAVGLDDYFGLIVRDADGNERVVRSGEVSVRGLYGYTDDK